MNEPNKHTGGDWKAHKTVSHYSGNPDLFEIHWSEEGECVAEVVHGEANANLLAAAPKLLDSLEAIVSFNTPLPYGLLEQARAAIAKAKGTP